MTTIKENRITHEVTVPHSPAPQLSICVQHLGTNYWRAWVWGRPSLWETGDSRPEAVGKLYETLTMTKEFGTLSLISADYYDHQIMQRLAVQEAKS